MPLNPLDTYFLIGANREITPVATFLKDRYFGRATHFNTSKVLIEFAGGDAYAAPYVDNVAGWIPTERSGRQIHEYDAPLIAPSRLMTVDELKKRGIAEALGSNKTESERAQEITIRDLAELRNRVARRKEAMAAELLTSNQLVVQEMVDRDQKGQKSILSFYDPSGSNPAAYTGSVWSTWATAKGHIAAMCADLAANGLDAADMILGSDVWSVISNMDGFLKEYDSRRANFGELEPIRLAPGVSYPGTININGFMLNIFVVHEQYRDDSGNAVSMFDPKKVVITAPNCGQTLFGAVTILPHGSEDFVTFAGAEEVPHVHVNNNSRELVLSTRPLLVPNALAPWRFTTALS